jgi:hypothetical protein
VGGRVKYSSSSSSESAHRSSLERLKEVAAGRKVWAVGERRHDKVEEVEAQMARDAHVEGLDVPSSADPGTRGPPMAQKAGGGIRPWNRRPEGGPTARGVDGRRRADGKD